MSKKRDKSTKDDKDKKDSKHKKDKKRCKSKNANGKKWGPPSDTTKNTRQEEGVKAA